ncbi:MAG: hypothetical protein AMK71_09175 [Nitrospira bacterium SG8_35_4]|nr:MAG: hypothetical protein AMK71_09175 [Nitrospira bacterium SG8_35_4]
MNPVSSPELFQVKEHPYIVNRIFTCYYHSDSRTVHSTFDIIKRIRVEKIVDSEITYTPHK